MRRNFLYFFKLDTVLLAFSYIVLIQSCAKLKIKEEPQYTNDNTSKFFTLPQNTEAITKRIAAYLQKKNNENEFVNNFVNNDGFAIWDKALIKQKPQEQSFQSGNLVGGDTLVIIPLVISNTNIVNGFIQAIVNDSINVSNFKRSDYDKKPFGTLQSPLYTADKYQLLMMKLDYTVFGFTKFKVVDNRLFAANTMPNGSTQIITITEQPQQSNLNSLPVCFDITDGIYMLCGVCGKYTCAGSELLISTSYMSCEEMPSTGGGPTFGNGNTNTNTNTNTPGGSVSVNTSPGTTPITPYVNSPYEDPNAPTPCEIAKEKARKMDSIYAKTNVDSVLATIPNLTTEPNEKVFPIFKKFTVNPYNVTDTTIGKYYAGPVQTATPIGFNISIIVPYLSLQASILHTHPPSGYSAQSAADVYALIENQLQNTRFDGTFVAASDGSKYAINVTDYTKAAAFFHTKSEFLAINSKWKEDSRIGKAYTEAYKYFKDKYSDSPNKENFAYEMAMSTVLSQFDVGVTLSKKDNTGKFKPIVVKTSPNPNKPKRKIYTFECI